MNERHEPAITCFNRAMEDLRKAQEHAYELWKDIDVTDAQGVSLTLKQVPWTMLEEMTRRIDAVNACRAKVQARAAQVQGALPAT